MIYICIMIKYRVAQYIEKEKLLTRQDKVLVALSGGADSVALLRILLSLGYSCEAAHCNFHLRGEESDRDEQFVRQLCLEQKIYLHVIGFDTLTYARKKKISIEMSARELRYQWFSELKQEQGFSAIAIAHHQDDSIETMLLNLIRGTGINGLLGIRPRNGAVVRPFLCITRNQILDYLNHIGQAYVTDSTNLQDEYTRNKIRLKLVPFMQEINPSVKEALFQTSNHLEAVSLIYQQTIEEGKRRVLTNAGIHIESLLTEPSPSALLFEILYPLGFTPSQIEDIGKATTGQPGKQFISNQGWRVIKDRELLLVEKNKTNESSNSPRLLFEEKEYDCYFSIPKDRETACFDADKLKEPLLIRKWEPGDWFIPFGMTGKKRISDYLTDRKFTLSQKENQWVLCSNGHIAWVIGERTDNRFRVDESTRRIIVAKSE